jgi:Flp pilus assembly protein CpaB
MRIGRLLLIAGVILVLGAVVIGGIIVLRNRQARNAATPALLTENMTPAPEALGFTQIVVAAQNIPRGTRITADNNAVVIGDWPQDALPAGVIGDLEDVYGRVVRADIVLGMPVLEASLTDQAGDLAGIGSDAALQVPAGMVAYAIPAARYSSAAWALRSGDRVDVILSLLMSDLDEEFQTEMLNNLRQLTGCADEDACSADGPYGRLEVLPTGWMVNIAPGEPQRPRLVTQLSLQNVLVLQVGDWPEDGVGPEAEPTPLPAVEGEPAPTPVPTRAEVVPLTLAVTQQDALVLEYAQAIGARFTFALRSAGDSESVATESVTLQYLMDRFSIELPPKLPYGVTPPLRQLEPIGRNSGVGTYGNAAAAPAATE